MAQGRWGEKWPRGLTAQVGHEWKVDGKSQEVNWFDAHVIPCAGKELGGRWGVKGKFVGGGVVRKAGKNGKQ